MEGNGEFGNLARYNGKRCFYNAKEGTELSFRWGMAGSWAKNVTSALQASHLALHLVKKKY